MPKDVIMDVCHAPFYIVDADRLLEAMHLHSGIVRSVGGAPYMQAITPVVFVPVLHVVA